MNRIRHDKKLESLAFLLDEDDGSSMKTVIDSQTNGGYQIQFTQKKKYQIQQLLIKSMKCVSSSFYRIMYVVPWLHDK